MPARTVPGSSYPATGALVRVLRDGPGGSARSDPSDGAGPVGEGAVADLAAGDWKLGNGHREAAAVDLLICSYDPRSTGVIMYGAHAVRTPCRSGCSPQRWRCMN